MVILSNGTAAAAVAPTTDLRKRLSQVKKAQCCGASEKKTQENVLRSSCQMELIK